MEKLKIIEKLNDLDNRLTKPLNEIGDIIFDIAIDPESERINMELFKDLIHISSLMTSIDIFENGIKVATYFKANKRMSNESFKNFLNPMEVFIKENLSDQLLKAFRTNLNSYMGGTLADAIVVAEELKKRIPQLGDMYDENLSFLKKKEKTMKKYKTE